MLSSRIALIILHLYSVMTNSKMEALLGHFCAISRFGKALIIKHNLIKLSAGSECDLLAHNINSNIDSLDNNWTMHLIIFIFERNATVHTNNIWIAGDQRKNNLFLINIKTNITAR